MDSNEHATREAERRHFNAAMAEAIDAVRERSGHMAKAAGRLADLVIDTII